MRTRKIKLNGQELVTILKALSQWRQSIDMGLIDLDEVGRTDPFFNDHTPLNSGAIGELSDHMAESFER